MTAQSYLEDKLHQASEKEHYSCIRPDVLESLTRYAVHRVPTGAFLGAVLCNDLREAVGRADPENCHYLKEIVTFVYMELPGNCWGSAEKVLAWLKGAEE